MHTLSDKLLLSSYKKANELKLNDEFIALIEKEMKRRAIRHQKYTTK
ncbi:sporulation histidine kinase inhibitor Sda [Domibacillus epiphyticus]|uniref:Check point factor coupling initiation of sporulation and replication initiation n=1 Tax=Domibacillus epiphyticus TaxID=1714355 RepID=A0A1V2A9C7_9BACI|nr:sporulation histidine kinase inhibitor Sda [Domibacillus epiphyticus]OMP67609.1 check point factor coupling initiation of sporulation and replication initiation [Domibacillus epiphyticus]